MSAPRKVPILTVFAGPNGSDKSTLPARREQRGQSVGCPVARLIPVIQRRGSARRSRSSHGIVQMRFAQRWNIVEVTFCSDLVE
jgi:hypothetical protein